MKRIVWLRPDGGISVTQPIEPLLKDESEIEYLDRMAIKFKMSMSPSHLNWIRVVDVEPEGLPLEQFRDSWCVIDGKTTINLDAAITKLLSEIRQQRNAKLVASDAEKAKLEDIGTVEQKRKLAIYRQALRDFPSIVAKEIEKKTIEELEKYIPVWPS